MHKSVIDILACKKQNTNENLKHLKWSNLRNPPIKAKTNFLTLE